MKKKLDAVAVSPGDVFVTGSGTPYGLDATAVLTCEVSWPYPPPTSYQWFKDGTAIDGEISQMISFLVQPNFGAYTCLASNNVASQSSEPAAIASKFANRCKFLPSCQRYRASNITFFPTDNICEYPSSIQPYDGLYIVSPNYGLENYDNNLACVVDIQNPLGADLKFEFTDFDLEVYYSAFFFLFGTQVLF